MSIFKEKAPLILEERRQKRKGWTAEDAFHVCVVSYSVALQDLHALTLGRH